MANLITAFEVVLPLFLMLALGYGVRRLKLVTPDAFNQMNTLTFRIFLPLVIFRNIYISDFSQAFNGKLILVGILIVLAMFGIAFVSVVKLEKENRRRGVLIQSIFRSNFIIFGLSVAMNLYGDDVCGPISMLITAVIPVYNVLAVIALEVFHGEAPQNGEKRKLSFMPIVKGIVTNPLIIGAVLGILIKVVGLKFPTVLEDTLADLTAVATPLALVVLGGTFEFGSVKHNLRPLLIGLIGRLVVMPCIFIPLCVLLGFRNVDLLGLMVMLAAPTAVSSFTMAQQMGGDGELAGQLVVFGTLFSVFTIFCWTFALTSFGWL